MHWAEYLIVVVVWFLINWFLVQRFKDKYLVREHGPSSADKDLQIVSSRILDSILVLVSVITLLLLLITYKLLISSST